MSGMNVMLSTVASGQNVIGPINTVALAGTNATLHCSVTSTALSFSWNYNGAQICSTGVCTLPYSYNSSSTSSYLTVPCSLRVAGVYQCSPFGSPPGFQAQSAQLIVLGNTVSSLRLVPCYYPVFVHNGLNRQYNY